MTAVEQQLTRQQTNAALAGAEQDVHRATAVQAQPAAIGQGALQALASGAAQVGHGLAPRQLRVGDVAATAGDQEQAEQFQRLAPMGVWQFTQHLAGGTDRHCRQGALQLLQALPGPSMLGVGSLPGLECAALGLIQPTVPVQHQPMAGLLDDGGRDGRFGRTVHSA